MYQSQDILTFWLTVLYINTLGNRNSRSVPLSYFYAPLLDTYTLSQHWDHDLFYLLLHLFINLSLLLLNEARSTYSHKRITSKLCWTQYLHSKNGISWFIKWTLKKISDMMVLVIWGYSPVVKSTIGCPAEDLDSVPRIHL